jgi:hypothetical protein
MLKPTELVKVAFPQCSVECGLIRHTGCCECDSVCPHKFRPSKVAMWEQLSQRDLDQYMSERPEIK